MPSETRKLVIPGPKKWARIDRMLRAFEDWLPGAAKRQPAAGTWENTHFFAVITARKPGVGFTAAWLHAWSQVWFGNTAQKLITKPGGINSTRDGDQYGKPCLHAADPIRPLAVGTLVVIRIRVDDKSNSVLLAEELAPKPATFIATISGSSGAGWPKSYGWAEAETTPAGYQLLANGRNSGMPSLGVAKNRVEMLTGFGASVGPYGQPLSTSAATATVQPIADGSHVEMLIEKSGNTNLPRFEAVNGLAVACS